MLLQYLNDCSSIYFFYTIQITERTVAPSVNLDNTIAVIAIILPVLEVT